MLGSGNDHHRNIDGNNLNGCMEDNHLSEHKVKYYLCHVLMALDSLHASGTIYREGEPQNTPINQCPLTDETNDSNHCSFWHDKEGDNEGTKSGVDGA
jgi:hypothetical protein